MNEKKDFRKFYIETSHFLHRYVKSIEGAEYMADDIMQETYFRAFKYWEKVSQHPNQYGWLCLTSGFVANNMLRRKENKEIPLELLTDAKEEPKYKDVYETVEYLIMLEDNLSGTELDLIVSHYMKGYTTVEIAAMISASEESVRMRLSRARRKMKDMWER